MLTPTANTRTRGTAIVAVLCVLMATLVLVLGPGTEVAEAQPDVGGIPDPSACYGVADEAFGSSGGAPDGLSVIGRLDGATANIGGETGTTDIEAIAFGPGTIIDPALAQQVLYTFDGTDFGYLNLTTGTFTSLGLPAPDGFATVDGMTWDPQLNVFWVTDRIGDDGVADRVAAYDPFTGGTTIGPFSTGIATEPGWTDPSGAAYDDFDDIALDPINFRLYAILNKGGVGGGLVELSKVDGSVIDYVGLFTPSGAASDFDGDGITDDMEGLAFFNDGNLYGSTGANGPGADINRFYSIDLATGTTTWIADFTEYGDYEALGCLTVEAFIDVEKGTAEPGGAPEDADVGPGPTITTGTVEWTYVITNESLSLDLENVVLVDDQIAGVLFDQATGETQCAEGVILAAGELLAPQASVTCTVTGTTVDGPYTNNATATGQADPGNGLPLLDLIDIDPSNYVGDPVVLDPPVLEVIKTAVAGAGADCSAVTPVDDLGPLVTVPVGGIVTFCVTVTNTGGSPATAVTVTDDNATPADAADDFIVTGLDNIDLDPAASATGSFEVTVTSLDPVVNTVAATGTDPANPGTPITDSDPAQVGAIGSPALEVVKTAVEGNSDCAGVTPIPGDDAVTVAPGTEVTFCVTVTNTGNAPATAVTVVDDNFTPADPADDFNVTGLVDITLAAGESASGLIVVTAAAEGVNSVTATGTDPNDPGTPLTATDPAGILLLGPPVLEVVKTVVEGTSDCVGVTPAPGGDAITVATNATVTYCVTVTNTGETPATQVTVTDDNLTPADPADDVTVPGLVDLTLAPGESATGALVFSAGDAGVNTVTAVGVDPNNPDTPLTSEDPAEILVLGPPELTVVKTAVAGASDCVGVTPAVGADDITVEIGDTVTFCVTVTNIGETAATEVTVTDDNLTPADPTDDVDVTGLVNITLAPGASATGALEITAADAGVNTVTAVGTDPNTGLPTNEPTDPAEVLLLGPPVLEVVKTAVAGASDCAGVAPAPGADAITVEINSTVTYCVTVTNTGETEATEVTVTDDNLTPADPADDVDVTGLVNITLAPGASATGALEIAAANAGVNTVTAVGVDPNTGLPTNQPTDPAEILLLGPPELTVVKTAVAGDNVDCSTVTPAPDFDEVPTTVGAVVTFCVTVSNIGETEATQVTVTDDNFTPADPSDDTVIAGLNGITLAAGASATGSFTYTVVDQTPLTNTVTATGVDPNTGLPTNSPTDTAGLRPPQGNAELAVVKTAAVGANVDCATVAPAQGEDVQEVKIGDSVTFCVTVTNVGDGPASNVAVVDDNFTPTNPADDTTVVGLDGIDLAPGASATGSIVFLVTELGAKTNIVAATGTDVNANAPTNEPSDPSGVVPFGTPILTVVKTAVLGTAAQVDCATVNPAAGLDEIPVQIGDSVTYCIIVTNTGNGPATNVQAIDDNFTPGTTADDVVVAEVAELAPGASLVGSFTKVVASAIAQKNTARATGTDPVTGLPTNEPTDPAGKITPAIDLVKQILRGSDQPAGSATEGVNELIVGEAGDTVTWVYTVTNTGSMPLIVEEILDPSLGITVPLAAADQLILPGQSVSVTTDGVVTATGATSTATVAGQPADAAGQPVVGFTPLTASNDAAEGPAAISLTKQILRGADRDCSAAAEGVNEDVIAEPGDAITWCFVITNTGVSSLTNVVFTDQDLNQVDIDLLAETGSPVLAPGATITRSANDTVESGGVVNVASVAGVPSDPTGDITGPAFVGAPTLEDTNTAQNNSIEIKLEKRVLLGFDADCSTAIEGVNEGVKGRLGDDVTWCFTAINTGSVALRVTEIVDETLDVVLAIPEAEQVLVASDPDASVTVQLNGTIDRDTTVNTASVDGSPVDPVTGDPIIDAETGEPVPPIQDTNTATKAPTTADLRLDKTKTLPEGGAKIGSIIDYAVEIENKGPDTALDVEMIDTLPAGLEYVETPTVEGWLCTINAANDELLCERDRLRVGVTEVISYQVRITEAAAKDVSLVNTATVGFSGLDPTPEDNTDTESVTVPGPVRITVTERFDPPVITVAPPPDEVLPVVTPPLAVTGSDSGPMVLVASMSILMGGVFMVLGRRRREDQQALL